jgi:hypothetical protein
MQHLKRPILDLMEMRMENVDWINLAQDRDRLRIIVNTVMNLPVPQETGNFYRSRVDPCWV